MLLNLTQGVAVFYGVSPTNAVYLFAFLFSVMFGIIGGVRTERPIVGAVIFFVSLFAFAIMGAFPLWILALPVIILILLYSYKGGN